MINSAGENDRVARADIARECTILLFVSAFNIYFYYLVFTVYLNSGKLKLVNIKQQEHPASVFSELSVRRSKYCL